MTRHRPGISPHLGHCVIPFLCLASLLTACSTRAPSEVAQDSQQEQLHNAAHAAFRRGNYAQAVRLYEQALQRAYLRDDANAIANALYNLAASQARLRDFDTARQLLHQARAALERVPAAQTADVLLLEATVAYRQGDLDAARHVIGQALQATPAAPNAVRSALYVLQGHIAFTRQDLVLARQALAAADQYRHDERETAGRAQLIGEIALLANDPLYAAAAFDREADLQRAALYYTAMFEALGRAGTAYAAGGAWAVAAKRFLRAGRSAQLQGADADAVYWLGRAIDAARTGDVSDIAEQAEERLQMLRNSTLPTY